MYKSKIFFKWILPIGIIVCLYFSTGSLIDSNLNLNDLIKVEGNITNHDYYESYSRFSVSRHMRLFLDNGNEYYVESEWDNKFVQIENALKESTYTEIYHRKPSQIKWRLGKINNIYQLKIGNVIIYDISNRQEKSIQVSILFGVFGIIGLTTLIIRRIKKNKNKP